MVRRADANLLQLQEGVASDVDAKTNVFIVFLIMPGSRCQTKYIKLITPGVAADKAYA